ncbi:hypothetical protein PsorP6_006214 [Peronosclerospora sorghi]|uniref:Uncharacterized protein n=1 Tax=Peronosclerospora sorghi TaxID=230839 RepID=A0ACC0W5K4_9STRA|nr:hypothetical protein PsorP6_006214 [Peronosclerospora sorghi]
MKILVSAIAVMMALISVVKAVEREEMLKVVASVHGNKLVSDTDFDDLLEDKEERECYGHLTRDVNPVCGSNGHVYPNISFFNFRKCMMKVLVHENIQVVDMAFCKEAEMEDMQDLIKSK